VTIYSTYVELLKEMRYREDCACYLCMG